MENVCYKYALQVIKAKETMGTLEAELHEIRLRLRNEPTHSGYLKELKKITLDMTITLNELEHCQSRFEECEAELLKAEEKYND
jgi:hypothetical protein